ncbi:hypothetical protein EV421DRAFT_1730176, partial [Armillaria borealis]
MHQNRSGREGSDVVAEEVKQSKGAGMFGVLFEWTCVMPDDFDREVFLLWESVTTMVWHCQVAGSQEVQVQPGRNMLSLDVPASVHTHIDASDHHIEGTTCPIVREVVGVPGQQNAMVRSLQGCCWLGDRRLCCHQDDNIEEGDTLLRVEDSIIVVGYCVIEGDGGQTEKSTSLKARGSCDKFLGFHLETFCAARRVSVTKAHEYVDSMLMEYYAVYHWSLKHNQKPLPENPPQDPSAIEQLSPQQAKYKAAHISMMCLSIDRIFSDEGLKADIALGNLLEDMCRIKKTCEQALTVPQLWSKDHWKEEQEQFDEWFKAQDLPDKERSTQQVVYTITTFNALLEEEHQGYLDRAAVGKGKRKSKAKAVREEAEDDQDVTEKDVMEDGLELTPVGPEGRLALEDLQVAWENVEAIAYPFIEALRWKLNMRLSCFIGGPVPGDG